MAASTVGVIKQFLAAIAAAMSVFIAGCWLGWASPAVGYLTSKDTHLEITPDQVSWVVALMDFGNTLSPIPSGYMADSLGRKRTLLITAFLYLATWLLTIFATSFWFLVVARIGAGMGKGVAFTVVPMYLGEIAGIQVRGAVSTIFTGLLYGGILLEYSLGPFVSYSTLNIISGIVPILFFLMFFLLPDSPYFLLMKERQKEARKALAWFRHVDKNDPELESELDQMRKSVQKEMTEKGSFKDLCATAGNRKAMTIVMVLSAFQRLGGVSPMLAYTTKTLPKTGGYWTSDIYMIWFGLTMVVGNFVGTPLIDLLGRKPLLIISCTLCALFTGISTVFYAFADSSSHLADHLNWIPYFCFVAYGVAYSIGIGIIPSTFVGELFPTNIKSFASAIAAIFFAVASFLLNKVYLLVKAKLGTQYMFGFFTLSSIFSVVFTIFYVFETTGKTFQEIQNKLNNVKDETLMMNGTKGETEETRQDS